MKVPFNVLPLENSRSRQQKPEVSIAHCKICHNPRPEPLRPLYALHSFTERNPLPYHVALYRRFFAADPHACGSRDDHRPPSGARAWRHQPRRHVRDPMERVFTPSGERESDLQHSRPQIIQHWSRARPVAPNQLPFPPDADWLQTTARTAKDVRVRTFPGAIP